MSNARYTPTQDIILSNIAPLLDDDRKRTVSTVRKIAVFDMDETLGIFSEFGEFIHILTIVLNAKLGFDDDSDSNGSEDNDNDNIDSPATKLINKHFTQIMDLYPELLRPKILEVMRFLSRMKRVKRCSNVMIYTNNTGPISWTNNIKNFFNSKARYEVFDKVIGAFRRPNGEVVEVKRTTHDKTYADLVRCTNMMGKFEVFFIDDRKHPGMHAENVYVIRVKPYSRHIPMHQFISRFKDSRLFHSLNFKSEDFDKYLTRATNDHGRRPYTDEEREVDDVIGTTILEKLREFFGAAAGDDGGQESRSRSAATTATARSGRLRSGARITRRRM